MFIKTTVIIKSVGQAGCIWVFKKAYENDNKLKSFNSLPKEVLEYQEISMPSIKLSIHLCNFSMILLVEGLQNL